MFHTLWSTHFNSVPQTSVALGDMVALLEGSIPYPGLKSVRRNWPLWSPMVSRASLGLLLTTGRTIYIVPKFQIRRWDHTNLMSKCFDHKTTFQDTNSRRIAISTHQKLSFELGFSSKRATYKKHMLGFAASSLRIFPFLETTTDD